MRVHSKLFACLLIGLAPPALAQDRAIIFGDSLSDNGNWTATGGLLPPPNYQPGSASNGPLWAEQLFGPMNSPIQGTGASGNVNMAFFGARTDGLPATTPFFPLGVPGQIDAFFLAGGTIDPTDIVVVWAGANNIRECIDLGNCGSQPNIATNMGAAAASQIANVNTLISQGAGTILVPNALNLGIAPYYSDAIYSIINPLGPSPAHARDAALAAKNEFNSALFSGLKLLAAAAPPGTNVIYADIDAALQLVIDRPAAFGLTNITDPCFNGVTTCANPNSYFYWDVIHPSEAVHSIIAQYFSLLLNTAPALLDTAPLGEVAFRSSELVTNAVFDRLTNWFTGVYAQKNGPYIEVVGQFGRYGYDYSRSDYDLDLGGVRMGWDKQIGTSLIGASAAVLGGDQNSLNLSSDVTTVRGDIYGIYYAGPVYMSANASFAGLWLDDISRATGFGPVIASADTDGYAATAAAEVGIAHQLGTVMIIPSARISYIHSELNGYGEQSDLLAFQFDDRDGDGLLGRISLRAVSNHNVSSMPTAFIAEVGYENYLSFSGNEVTAVLANNTALPTTVIPSDISGPGFLGKIGLSSEVSGGLFFDLNYGIAVHDEGGETHTGSGRLKAHF